MADDSMPATGSSESPAATPAETPFQTPYPSYDVLAKWDSPSFNDATRRVVAHRLGSVPGRRHFDAATYELLRAVVECILPQPERDEATRIPVEAWLDEALAEHRTNGTRYVEMPPAPEAWRLGLAGIEHEAQRRHERAFADLTAAAQTALLQAIDRGEVDADGWGGMKPQRFFRQVLLTDAVKVYYAHPSAWNEIGFGGPAAPRGYLRTGFDERDPWEAAEERAPQPVTKLR